MKYSALEGYEEVLDSRGRASGDQPHTQGGVRPYFIFETAYVLVMYWPFNSGDRLRRAPSSELRDGVVVSRSCYWMARVVPRTPALRRRTRGC